MDNFILMLKLNKHSRNLRKFNKVILKLNKVPLASTNYKFEIKHLIDPTFRDTQYYHLS